MLETRRIQELTEKVVDITIDYGLLEILIMQGRIVFGVLRSTNILHKRSAGLIVADHYRKLADEIEREFHVNEIVPTETGR